MSELSKDKVFKNKKKDFDKNSFPSTRVKLFKKIFLSHFGKLVLVNVLCFLFFIPLIFWDLFSTLYKSNINDVSSLTSFIITIESPLKIICYLICFVGLSGIIYYIRKLSWGEPVRLFNTFFTGIKQSYKQFLVFGFIFSLFACLLELSLSSLRYVNYSNTHMIFFYGLLIVSLVLMLSIVSYCLTMSSLYYLKTTTIIKYSFLLTIKNIFLNVLFVIISYGIILSLFMLGNVYLYFIGIFIVGFIAISYTTLLWVTYANKSYDVYINLKQYPNFFRKGLKSNGKEGELDA